MRDINDRGPVAFEVRHNPKKTIDLSPGQRGGGFIHDQDARIAQQRAGDLHELSLSLADVRDARAQRRRRPQAGEDALRLRAHRAPIQHSEPVARRSPDEQVFQNGKIAIKARFLIHGDDALIARLRRTAEFPRHAVDFNCAAVEPVGAGQDFDERALARPVLPKEGMHLAALKIKIDASEDGHAAEAFSTPRMRSKRSPLTSMGTDGPLA
jgi:hypothetical protein